MIELATAVEIVKKHLKTKDCVILNYCRDLVSCWVFDWGLRSDPFSEKSTPYIKIEKETGAVDYFSLGVPGEENFESFMKAPYIDISDYLTAEEKA